MAIKTRPLPPTAGKSSTEKKVAASRAAEFEIGAIDTKKAIAEPKVLKPVPKKLTKTEAAASVAEEPKKETAKKAPTKKAAAKKTVAKKATEEKAVAKKAPAKKTVAKKAAEPKKTVAKSEKFEIQFAGKNITTDEITAKLQAIYADLGRKKTYIKKASFYVKPEESRVYYVVNDTETGDFWI